MQNDTIAAISTPPARGGIGVIRMSGEKSREIAEKIFISAGKKSALPDSAPFTDGKRTNLSSLQSHTIRYGFVFDPGSGKPVDEVLITFMEAPKTYTREDIIEINCHSGLAVLNKIMDVLIENGARLAERGEFTKRAFLNGRIDLTRAEAVTDLIMAKTEAGRASAVNQLSGRLYKDIKSFMDRILLCLANIEASIDYPEHTEAAEQQLFLRENIGALLSDAQRLYDTSDIGRIIREGINTVIIGETNVGKSSLLNWFAGCDRAIVTDIHGTTRDILEESVNINGVLLKLSDTAGIRETDDIVEKIGVERAISAAKSADLVLRVFDASIEAEDCLLESVCHFDAKVIAVVNKCDLQVKINVSRLMTLLGAENVFLVSAKDGSGLAGLTHRIREMFFSGALEYGDDALISNARQKSALLNAINALKRCIESIEGGFPEDIVSIDLMEAYSCLGEITGDSLSEDLADKIFSEFCLGK